MKLQEFLEKYKDTNDEKAIVISPILNFPDIFRKEKLFYFHLPESKCFVFLQDGCLVLKKSRFSQHYDFWIPTQEEILLCKKKILESKDHIEQDLLNDLKQKTMNLTASLEQLDLLIGTEEL